MRVTEHQKSTAMLSRLKSNDARLQKSMEEVVTGSRVNRASDDPTTHAAASKYRTQAVRYENMVDNNDQVKSYFEAADSALASASGAMDAAVNLAQQMASGPRTPDQMAAAVKTVQGLREQVLDAANSQFRGAAIFGGIDDTNPAFDDTGGFLGSATSRRVPIAPGESIDMMTGATAFGSGANSAFDALNALESALSSGDQSAVGAAIDSLRGGREAIVGGRQEVGEKLNMVEFASNFMSNAVLSNADRAGELTDADIAASIANVQSATGTMQLAVQASARVNAAVDSLFKL
ncbi:MAG: hypothetical protein R3E66_18235 [bacterium]